MKSAIKLFLLALLAISSFSFIETNEISNCYLSFSNPSNLTATQPDRLPVTAEKIRKLKTDSGEVAVTRIDGYRVLYNNDKKTPFINLKVELSNKESYANDQKALIRNLKYLNSHSIGMETKELIELEINGYKVSGFSRASIETASTLGTFVMFPGKGVTVYFYFNNLKPGFRHFESVEEYKKLRDKFMQEYTMYLKNCLAK
jgi:hypothetical protein